MYSDKKNILQLVALLKAHSIIHIVVCPGSRNAPIVHTLANCEDFKCYTVTDERSAGFFAIGLALRLNETVGVCCTSGSAVLNLQPAVSEAFYQRIPLVVITADRPAAWIGQMDGQTLPQPNVFGTLVKKSVNLPEIHTTEDEWYCNRLINEAILNTHFHNYGPVHINIPLSEPLFEFNTKELPEVRTINRFSALEHSKELEDYIRKCCQYEKILIIAGQDSMPFSVTENYPSSIFEQYTWFAEDLCNSIKNDKLIRNFDTALYTMTTEEKKTMAPDVVITLNGHIVSKRLKQYLRSNPPKEHIHVSPNGAIADVFCSLTVAVEQNTSDFIHLLSVGVDEHSTTYSDKWQEICSKIPEPEFAYSEMLAIATLIHHLPKDSILHLANSSTIRYAQLFKISSPTTVCCNRGINGIEGSLSTAIGCASANPNQLNFIIIGDLSFFYDMNALWNSNYSSNVRILLLNNGSGEIFHSLPGLEMTTSSRGAITATHTTSAKGWAEERGFEYICINGATSLEQNIKSFTTNGASDRPILMEVRTDAAMDVKLLKDYYHQLKH